MKKKQFSFLCTVKKDNETDCLISSSQPSSPVWSEGRSKKHKLLKDFRSQPSLLFGLSYSWAVYTNQCLMPVFFFV